RIVAAMRPRERGLRRAADGADHGRAEKLGPLAHDQADAAGGGMDQDRVALLHAIGLLDEVTRGHAADHHRGRGAILDPVRQHDGSAGRDDPLLRIGGVGRRHADDPLAEREARPLGPDRLDHPRALHAEAGRKRLHRVSPAPHQHVAEIDGDRGIADAQLAGAGLPDRDVLEAQNLGAAVSLEADRLHRRYACRSATNFAPATRTEAAAPNGASPVSASSTSVRRRALAPAGPRMPTMVALPASASLPVCLPTSAGSPSTSSRSSAIWNAWPTAEP